MKSSTCTLRQCKRCVDRLNEYRRVQDVPWIGVDWSQQHKRVDAVHRDLMLAAARILPLLQSLPRTRYWSDYFGQLYSFLAREAYHAMTRGDEALFSKIFSPLFVSSILANQKLRQDLSEKDVQLMLSWSSGPIIDILTLSGYAKLFAELDGKSFYTVVSTTWDNYLATFDDPTIPLKAVVAMAALQVGSFFMPARDLERTAWQQNFSRLLRSRGLLLDRYGGHQHADRPVHHSPLIREFCRGPMMMEQASDVFLVDYVMPKMTAITIEFPYTARNLAKALERHKNPDPSSSNDNGTAE